MSQTLYDDLLQELPRLRRHAMLLLGDRRKGDALIAGLLQSPSRLRGHDPQQPFRQLLLKALHGLVIVPGDDPPPPLPPHGPMDGQFMIRALAALPLRERRALLLMELEQLAPAEAAAILDLTELEMRRQLRDARAAIARMTVPVLIIEDEWLIGEQIRQSVEAMGYWVCGTADRFDQALEAAARTTPGLVLADVGLADGAFAGLEAAREIQSRYNNPTIYITGFPERVVAELAASDATVIPKPMNPRTLRLAMHRALGDGPFTPPG